MMIRGRGGRPRGTGGREDLTMAGSSDATPNMPLEEASTHATGEDG